MSSRFASYLLIFTLIFSWVYSGWPRFSHLPGEIQKVFAAVLSTLRPTGDGTASGLGYSTGTTAWSLIDDDPDSVDTADYIVQTRSTSGTDSAFLLVTDMPSDFGSMATLQVDVHVSNASGGNDTIVLTAQIFESNETSALTDEVQLSTDTTTSGLKTGTFTLQGNNTKTVWDGARIKFVWTYTKVQGSDTNSIRVNAAELDGTYNVDAAPTIAVDQPDGVSDAVTVGDNYSIQYDLADSDSVVTAAFSYDSNNSGLDGTAISGACATAAEGTNATCSWNTTGVTPGSYYVYGITSDGVNPQVSAYSSGQITIDAPANTRPTASGASVDSDAAAITLNEGTTKNVLCTGSVTDNDGFADITSVTADFYRTSVGTSSPEDANNYYQLSGDSECVPSGGSGNSETYTCTFTVDYYADPTDSGSPNSSDTWTCMMAPFDAGGQGSASADTIEVNSLMALSVTASISYGSLNPNADTGGTNQTTTVTNTGNRDMDPLVSGTNMTNGGSTILVGQQKYSASTFTYSSGGTALTTGATAIDLTLPQRTGAAVTDDIYWGLGVPDGTAAGSYSGTNTFTADAGL